jgi:DNA polymerase-3 subunit delta
LVLYKKGENEVETIDTTDVDLLVRANFEAKIFSLMDAVASKNIRRAAELLNSFLESGENEIYILTMIEKQFQNIAMAKFESNITESSFAKKADIHPYVAKKSLQQAKNFEKIEIITMYQRLMDADLKLKSGFEPKQVLLRVIM